MSPWCSHGVWNPLVYVVKDDSPVEVRHIVLGPTEGDKAAVENGLAPGEVVVMEGVDQLSRGMQVAARLAGASTVSAPTDGGQGASSSRWRPFSRLASCVFARLR